MEIQKACRRRCPTSLTVQKTCRTCRPLRKIIEGDQ
ncbi:unnamed protein product [Heligmosomoides polygyrus]|uniref:Uncharacterized protein n=1 Tax=Heligmosomoides polygyrus TaxID=6339 RepID=A0A3P8CU82_HELPZ|nr:unnamed protein product [Heligmosomoides polygyrus]